MNALADPAAFSARVAQWCALADYLAGSSKRVYGKQELKDQVARLASENGAATLLVAALAESFGAQVDFIDPATSKALNKDQPIIAWTSAGAPILVLGSMPARSVKVLELNTDGNMTERVILRKALRSDYQGAVRLRFAQPLDATQAPSRTEERKRWFWGSVNPITRSMTYLILAALAGNILAVGVSLFALQVWDRIIPSQSVNSLVVLLMGVGVAIIFEFLLRLQRSALIDVAGKRVDRSISNKVYAHMLRLRSDVRPASLGSLAAQIREIMHIREAISSSILSAAIDLPFVAIYVAIIWLIGGTLVFPILTVIPIVLLIGMFAQIPLARLATAGLEEASQRNGMIVESVLKADEIKLQQAEASMELRWNRTIDTAADIANAQRRWRNFLTGSTQSLQQMAYIGVVAYGAINVIAGDATMGQVIACSILANRAIAPLTQVSVVLGALQSSLVAKRSIDELMARPDDGPDGAVLRRDLRMPDLSLRDVSFVYPETEKKVLDIAQLEIPFGAKVGVIGRIGSGKSTLLQLLSGLIKPVEGKVLINDTDFQGLATEDLRSSIGFQAQSASLFRGSLRDNLRIAKPSASDDDIARACRTSGALDFISKHPLGLDLMINEAGAGLSDGQRQCLLLARLVLRRPDVLLLDEPTASMDDDKESEFVRSINSWASQKTLVITTHRMRLLSLCDRIIVMKDGRIAMDGPRADILGQLKNKVKEDA